jgi:TonB family protein
MTKNKKIESLFTDGGCLSAEAINKYVNGLLSGSDNELVKKHINECAFCADAVEGYKNIKLKEPIVKTVQQINREIEKKYETVRPGTLFINRKILAYSSLAATVLILLGLFLLINNNKLRQNKIVSENLLTKEKAGPVTSFDSMHKGEQAAKTTMPKEHAAPAKHLHTAVTEGGGEQPAALAGTRQKSEQPAAETLEKYELSDAETQDSDELPAIENQAIEERILIAESEVTSDATGADITAGFGAAKSPTAPSIRSSETTKTVRYETATIRGAKKSAAKEYYQMEETLPVSTEIIDAPPMFDNDGIEKFKEYVQKNIKYPAKAKNSDIEGEVLVSFIVDSTGRVTDPKIISGIDSLLNREALRVVSSSPLWVPGIKNGQPVKTTYTIPVKFKLK